MKNNFLTPTVLAELKETLKERYVFFYEEILERIIKDKKIENPCLISLRKDENTLTIKFIDQNIDFLNSHNNTEYPNYYKLIYDIRNPDNLLLIQKENQEFSYEMYNKLDLDIVKIKQINTKDNILTYENLFKYKFQYENKQQFVYEYKDTKNVILFDLLNDSVLEGTFYRMFLRKLFLFKQKVSGEDFKDVLIIMLSSLMTEIKKTNPNSNFLNLEIAYDENYNLYIIRNRVMEKENNESKTR